MKIMPFENIVEIEGNPYKQFFNFDKEKVCVLCKL